MRCERRLLQPLSRLSSVIVVPTLYYCMVWASAASPIREYKHTLIGWCIMPSLTLRQRKVNVMLTAAGRVWRNTAPVHLVFSLVIYVSITNM